MLKFILVRLGLLMPCFIGVTLLTFSMVRLLPGDPIEAMLGERRIDPAYHAAMLERLGLDRPLWEQYGLYIGQIANADLGTSIVTNKPVITEFFGRFPATIELALSAMIFAVVLGIPIGIFAALRRGRAGDHMVIGAAMIGQSMPIFWWGQLLIMLISINLGWTPVSGRIAAAFSVPSETGFLLIDTLLSDKKGAFSSALSHLILPTIVLGTIPLAIIARMTRSAVIEVLSEDYIRTAKAKGLRPLRIVGVHALRNALISVVTIIGLQTGSLLAGAVLTETIFSWPGIGKWIIGSLEKRDYPVIQGGVLVIATVVMCVNLLVDLIYGWINPRIRRGR